MKKLIAVIAALSVSAFMLTACSDNKSSADDNITVKITASDDEDKAAAEDGEKDGDKEEDKKEAEDDKKDDDKKAETEAETTEKETEKETEAADEPKDSGSDAAAEYGSLEGFANASDVFGHKADAVAGENSYTYAFLKSLEGGSGFYVDLETLDGKSKVIMAIESDQVAVTAIGDASAFDMGMDGFADMSIMLADGKIYMMSTASKSGFYADMESLGVSDPLESIDVDEMLSEINGLTDGMDLNSIMSYKVSIGGETYTFEFDDTSGGTGMLYNSRGKVCLIIDGSGSFPKVIINEFSTNVPNKAFDVPSGYKVSDIMSMDEAELLELFAMFGFI